MQCYACPECGILLHTKWKEEEYFVLVLSISNVKYISGVNF